MNLNPYLTFKGDCEAAFKFYEKVLGGKIEPMIPHDATPDHYEPMKGFSVTLTLSPDKAAEADRIFQALAKGGTVRMPIQETFWAVRFGMLVDQFGTPWMINCDKAA